MRFSSINAHPGSKGGHKFLFDLQAIRKPVGDWIN